MAQTAALAQFGGGGGFGQFGGGGGDDLAPATPAWELFKLNTKTRVKINFRNASPDAIIQTLSQASGLTIIRDATLTAGITLQSPNAVPLKDAFAMFNLALGMRNFEIKKDGSFLVIKPKRAGFGGGGGLTGGTGLTFPGAPGGATQGILRTYALTFADATQVARVINEVFVPSQDSTASTNPFAGFGGGGGGGNPFAGRFGGGAGGQFGARGRANGNANVRASAETFSNSVIVNATSKDHEQVEKIIKSIDKQTDQPQQTRLFTPQYANVADLSNVVQSILVSNANSGRGGRATQQQGGGGGGGFNPFRGFGGGGFGGGGNNQNNQNVAVETRTHTIVVTASEESLRIVEKTIKQLDRPTVYASSAFVLTLDNARADDVAQLLNQAFSGQRSTGNTTGRTGTGTENRTNSSNAGNRA